MFFDHLFQVKTAVSLPIAIINTNSIYTASLCVFVIRLLYYINPYRQKEGKKPLFSKRIKHHVVALFRYVIPLFHPV